jgi:ribosomal protein L12E/L44/L45/RPP1/RPP2
MKDSLSHSWYSIGCERVRITGFIGEINGKAIELLIENGRLQIQAHAAQTTATDK